MRVHKIKYVYSTYRGFGWFEVACKDKNLGREIEGNEYALPTDRVSQRWGRVTCKKCLRKKAR